MKKNASGDHLSSSLTDLMTSLMVIFVLLLVTKLNNQAGAIGGRVEDIIERLKLQGLVGQEGEEIQRNGNQIVIVVPEQLMSFKQAKAELGGATLSEEGKGYLERHIPKWAEILCGPEIREQIDTVIVEGHSDIRGFSDGNEQTNKERNLVLSQQRSMSVVSESLNILTDNESRKGCFLEILSATGRGDAHPRDMNDPYSPKNRRVEFKIRVRSDSDRISDEFLEKRAAK
jgi:flagellar motor protein MotB